MYMLTFLLVASMALLICSANNQFETNVNPGCGEACNNASTQLVYGRLSRTSDSLHIFVTMGDSLGDLAVSYLQSGDPKQMVTVDWDAIFSDQPSKRENALKYSNPKAAVLAKFTLIFNNLIEYSDVPDQVDMTKLAQNSSYFRVHPFSRFAWRVQQQPVVLSNGQTQLVLAANATVAPSVDESADSADSSSSSSWSSSSSSLFQSDGSLQLSLTLAPDTGRAAQLPQLQFTGNNTQMELHMYHLTSDLPSARFAVEAALLDQAGQRQEVASPVNIDDEFTPGIFRVTNWRSVASCYAQWKPVCYTADERTIGTSTVVRNAELKAVSPGLAAALNASFVYSLYGGATGRLVASGRAINSTFGIPTDGFYAATNYTVWTVALGLGEPPADTVSTLVIVVILCGLGLPALLMTASLVYLCVRRFRQANMAPGVSAYQPINT